MKIVVISDRWFEAAEDTPEINLTHPVGPPVSFGMMALPKTPIERHHVMVPLFQRLLEKQGYFVKEIP